MTEQIWRHFNFYRGTKWIRLLFLAVLTIIGSSTSLGQGFGDCSDSVEAVWLEDGRSMKLLSEYTYIDGSGKVWTVPKEKPIDGASIPPIFWSFIGGPFEGRYRKASVPHDYECRVEREDWRLVHQMFYDAMRCSEVSEPRAKIMYGAVYHCGPRWGSQQGIRFFPCDDDFGKRLVRRLRRYLSKNPETTRQNLADLNEGDLDGISGEGLQEVLARAPQVEVHENLDGFEIVIDGFDSGDGSLPNRSAEVLQRAAPLLRSYATSVTVEGHTDPTGTNDANMALSWHRAGSVRAELIKYGLDPEAVNANAYGEERPVEFGDDPESYARNRRVEIVVREIQ